MSQQFRDMRGTQGTRGWAPGAGLAAAFIAGALLVSCTSQVDPAKLPALPRQDGKVLYAFLLEHIPEVVSEVPCACCGKSLQWCYEGGCPPS